MQRLTALREAHLKPSVKVAEALLLGIDQLESEQVEVAIRRRFTDESQHDEHAQLAERAQALEARGRELKRVLGAFTRLMDSPSYES